MLASLCNCVPTLKSFRKKHTSSFSFWFSKFPAFVAAPYLRPNLSSSANLHISSLQNTALFHGVRELLKDTRQQESIPLRTQNSNHKMHRFSIDCNSVSPIQANLLLRCGNTDPVFSTSPAQAKPFTAVNFKRDLTSVYCSQGQPIFTSSLGLSPAVGCAPRLFSAFPDRLSRLEGTRWLQELDSAASVLSRAQKTATRGYPQQ